VPQPTTFAMRENTGPSRSPDTQPAPELAVLVPTRNEAPNIEELVRRVSAAVAGRSTGQGNGSLREGLTYATSLGALRLGRAPWRA